MKGKRVKSLDYLRGIMAISVMIYHYSVWSGFELSIDSLLSKLGLYAVSVFYILSGLSLSIVYHGRIASVSDMGDFLIKRIFRIAPLFWISVSASLLLGFLKENLKEGVFEIDVYRVFLNYSLLFGFLSPSAYLSTGAWSIGNEMVFYVIFPILFFLGSKKLWLFPCAVVFSLILGIIFSTLVLDDSRSLVSQWGIYINPFNNLFLFMGGVAIGRYAKPAVYAFPIIVVIATMAFVLFWLYPVYGDRVQLVINFGRIILSVACISIVWAVYVSDVRLNGFIDRLLSFFGEGCYSIYLLHPLVAVPVIFFTSRMGIAVMWSYLLAAITTLGVSWITFKYVEKPMMRIGASFVRSSGSQTKLLE
jgi:exopolysaccharide production protein ExoZ